MTPILVLHNLNMSCINLNSLVIDCDFQIINIVNKNWAKMSSVPRFKYGEMLSMIRAGRNFSPYDCSVLRDKIMDNNFIDQIRVYSKHEWMRFCTINIEENIRAKLRIVHIDYEGYTPFSVSKDKCDLHNDIEAFYIIRTDDGSPLVMHSVINGCVAGFKVIDVNLEDINHGALLWLCKLSAKDNETPIIAYITL